jgi:hypothetical protein
MFGSEWFIQKTLTHAYTIDHSPFPRFATYNQNLNKKKDGIKSGKGKHKMQGAQQFADSDDIMDVF